MADFKKIAVVIMYIKAVLLIVVLFCVHSESAMYLKRADFDDPRMFTSSFGKRSVELAEPEPEVQPKSYRAIRIQRRSFDELDDPRLMSMSFGKRMVLPSLADLHRYTMYDKRGSDIDDPRFFSGAFGRK